MRSRKPTVSVIIPVFNRAALIGSAVRSVLEQTVPIHEIIVVDDGSTDRTAQVVRGFGGSVQYLYQENAGPAAARNQGVQRSSGAYVAFHDSDDLWVPERLEIQLGILNACPEIDFIFGEMANFSEYDLVGVREIRDQDCRDYLLRNWRNPDRFLELLLRDNFIPTPTVLLRRKIFDRVGLFDPRLRQAEDYEFWLRIAAASRVAFVPEILVRRRIHDANLVANWLERTQMVVNVLESTGRRVASGRSDLQRLIEERLVDLRYDLGSGYLKCGFFDRAHEALRGARGKSGRRLAWSLKWIAACGLSRVFSSVSESHNAIK